MIYFALACALSCLKSRPDAFILAAFELEEQPLVKGQRARSSGAEHAQAVLYSIPCDPSVVPALYHLVWLCTWDQRGEF